MAKVLTLQQLETAFLDWIKHNRAKRTYAVYKELIAHLGPVIKGSKPAISIRPHDLTKAIARHPDWQDNQKHNFIGTIKRMFSWGIEEGLISENPIEHARKPGREAREDFLTPEEFERIIRYVNESAFRDLLIFAWETGIRPEEAWRMEVQDFWAAQGRIVIPSKRAKGKRTPRVIYLTPTALEIVQRHVYGRFAGPILLNSHGTAWNRNNTNNSFKRLAQKVGKKYHLGAFRKGFATQALINGVDVITVSHLMGHADTSMLAKVYAKVYANAKHMEDAALRAKGQNPEKDFT